MTESDILSQSSPEVDGEGVHDGSAVESESLERARDLEKLVKCLGCLVLSLVHHGVGDVYEGDSRREGEVVENVVDSVVHGGIPSELDDLELLCSHESVGHFLHHHRRETCSSQIQLHHLLVLTQHLGDCSCHSLRHRQVVHSQHFEFLSHSSQTLGELLFHVG